MAVILDQLVERLRKAFAGDLVSVVLYGSAASGNHDERFSDYNVLCVLKNLSPAELRASEPVFRWWREQGNPAPLLLTEEEVRTSTDCFAIEFHDIRAHHQVLHGADVISGLEIDNTFYRAQVEQELRAKLLRLRQKASGVLSDKDALARLLADSVATFCVLLRHALILQGAEGPARRREVVEQAHQLFGIDAAPFMTLLDFREEKIKARDFEPEALLASYLKQIDSVIGAVDRLPR
jgi:hypothetical protein